MSYASLISDAAGYHDLQGAVTDGPGWWLPNATAFNGTSDYVDAGDLGVCEDLVFAYAVWVRFTSTAVTFPINEGNSGTTVPLIGLRLSGDDTRCWLRDDNNDGEAATAAATNDGEWHLLTQTSDGTTNRLYIDAVLGGSGPVPAGPISVDQSTIGALRRTATANYFDGDLAGALFSPNAWTADDVADYMAGPPAGNPRSLAHSLAHDLSR